MKCFTKESGSFSRKVNYVDGANRVLGYDMDRDCCENFGNMVCSTIPEEAPDDAQSEVFDLGPYSFCDEIPKATNSTGLDDDAGGSLAFRIAALGLPDLYVVIWNYHNGYYSHGWEWSGSDAFQKTKGSL